MANDVFANGREISCKKASGKSICAMPDVVWTPPDKVPPTPTGVPVPYPNTGMASDTSKGSKKVKISGKEAMLKNISHFKKSMGDEAGVAQLKGFMTMKNRGKIYFQMWSMDVKFESKNVVRHFDLTTHNHGSQAGNSPPWMHVDTVTMPDGTEKDPCEKDKEREKTACDSLNMSDKEICDKAGLGGKKIKSNKKAIKKGYSNLAEWKEKMSQNASQKNNDAAACVRARRCKLVPYKPNGCCPSQTGDHVIPKSSFYVESVAKKSKLSGWIKNLAAKKTGYKPRKAPCMCLEGTGNVGGTHGLRHSVHKLKGAKAQPRVESGDIVDFEPEMKRCAESASDVTVDPKCKKECIEAQLKQGHKDMGSGQIKHSPSGSTMTQDEIDDRVKNLGPTNTFRI